jgi:hypothetical protein
MKNNITYNGQEPDSREIDPTDWTWTYIFINKDATKNKKRYEALQKSLDSINEKIAKLFDVKSENFNKFVQLATSKNVFDPENIDVNDSIYDNLSGIKSIRNKILSCDKSISEMDARVFEITSEIKEIYESGLEPEVRIKTKEIVYAYDMQSYVKSHPEIYGNVNYK